MSADLKALVNRMYDEVLSGGNVNLIDEVLHDDFVEHELIPGAGTGKDATRAMVGMLRAGFPDVTVKPEHIVQEGDKVAVLARLSGTHEGEFMGIPATGRKIDIPLFDLVRFEGGKVIEHWGLMDSMTMMEQLGVTPEEAPG